MRSDAWIDGSICREYARSSSLEWLDTNGVGAYAMGTVAGVRTRRYHSLLNSGQPSQVWLTALEDTLLLDGESYELATHRYPGTITPKGYELLGEFRTAPYPCWLYRIGEATLLKEAMLIDGSPSVLVRYCCSEDATLDLMPFLAGRPQHELQQAHPSREWAIQWEPGSLRLTRQHDCLYIRCDADAFLLHPDWYLRFQYAVDQARGLDFEEDLWTPGKLRFELRADTWVYLVCSLNEDPGPVEPIQLLRAMEAKEKRFPPPRSIEDKLANAGEHFIFEKQGRKSVIAGYPWFTDWGRDTFISLPGLFLARNRIDDAARTIDSFLNLRRDGLIPNRITDDGSTPEYNSIDATLWLFIAVWQWLDSGGDRQLFHDRFFPAMRDMLATIARGTIYSIRRDPFDGLLEAGSENTQLTWMDARIHGRAVTPRSGKAVEINSLWYNSLRLMTDWARERGDFAAETLFGQMANQAITGFTASFWNERNSCLTDVLGDDAIRPNQLFALSLPYPLVVRSKGEAILKVVEQDLLTPKGLRTLSPRSAGYRPRFEGGPEQRDSAYHQGTVWPWLFGPYVRASIRVRGNQPQLRQLLLAYVESELDQGCLGNLPEVYDGDPPQRQAGTPAQAWSVAEILALLKRELAS